MRIASQGTAVESSSVIYQRCTINLANGAITLADVPCINLEDVFGGIGRSFQLLAELTITEAYSPDNPLILNTGLLTGSSMMTGLRAYFATYSPLKQSNAGLPGAMWAAGSGTFGAKLKWTGVDEIIFEDRAPGPVYLLVRETAAGPAVELKSAEHLLGLTGHEKIMRLHAAHPDSHVAAIGPAGEHWSDVSMAGIVMSTDNQFKSGEPKCRFAGRGGVGSVMGYKNLLAIVAQSRDQMPKVTPAMRDVNRAVLTNGGSARFQPISAGGSGGTWANIEVLQKFHAVPLNNFRPKGNDEVEKFFRKNVEQQFEVVSEACYRCGIRCHNNLYTRNPDGSRGTFAAKFDFEPLVLFGSNMGLHDPAQTTELIHRCDLLGMDAISLGTTISYVLDYNERHPDNRLLNGATFGDFALIRELVEQTGQGRNPTIGHGVKRLSQSTGDTAYAMHVKGLELPAYLPETNPGYIFAIAGGHMSMGTHMQLAKVGTQSVDEWAEVITKAGLLQVGYDMLGLCKFVGAGMGHELIAAGIKEATGLDIPSADIVAAVRRTYLRGLALEGRQGFSDEEYTLPAQVFENPNENVTLPQIITPEFVRQLKEKVWSVFRPEMAGLLPEVGK